MTITLNLDGLTFGDVDSNGTEWTVATEDGWYAPPPRRTRSSERPAQDGYFPARSLSAGRTYTITGLVKASSNFNLITSAQTFAAVANDGEQYVATWNDPTGEYSTDVERDNSKFEILTDSKARYSLTVRACDPRKYGALETSVIYLPTDSGGGLVYPLTYPLNYGTPGSGGSMTMMNNGTAPTEPIFDVSGPLAIGFEITHVQTARTLSYHQATALITLNCKDGTAVEGGQDRSRWMIDRQWFTVPAGSPATFSFKTLGTETSSSIPAPYVLVRMAPAYW